MATSIDGGQVADLSNQYVDGLWMGGTGNDPSYALIDGTTINNLSLSASPAGGSSEGHQVFVANGGWDAFFGNTTVSDAGNQIDFFQNHNVFLNLGTLGTSTSISDVNAYGGNTSAFVNGGVVNENLNFTMQSSLYGLGQMDIVGNKFGQGAVTGEFGGVVYNTQTLALSGPVDLKADIGSEFHPTLSGFAKGDTIDLGATHVTGDYMWNNYLILENGNQTAGYIGFAQTHSASDFAITNTPQGHAQITLA